MRSSASAVAVAGESQLSDETIPAAPARPKAPAAAPAPLRKPRRVSALLERFVIDASPLRIGKARRHLGHTRHVIVSPATMSFRIGRFSLSYLVILKSQVQAIYMTEYDTYYSIF